MDGMRADLKAKEEEIVALEQNLDMIESENMRLKEYEETIVVYEAEMDDIDEHYQKMLDDLDAQQAALNDVVTEREKENAELKGKVHSQSESIADLKGLLESMQSNAETMGQKQQQIADIANAKLQQKTARKSVDISNQNDHANISQIVEETSKDIRDEMSSVYS